MRRLALAAGSILVLSSGVFAEAAVGVQGNGPSPCKLGSPGQFISAVEPDGLNPGNPQNPLPPFVAAACNPSPRAPF